MVHRDLFLDPFEVARYLYFISIVTIDGCSFRLIVTIQFEHRTQRLSAHRENKFEFLTCNYYWTIESYLGREIQ